MLFGDISRCLLGLKLDSKQQYKIYFCMQSIFAKNCGFNVDNIYTISIRIWKVDIDLDQDRRGLFYCEFSWGHIIRLIEKLMNCYSVMDSEYQRDGRLMDMIDEKWRSDELPKEDIMVPLKDRPEPEQDNGPSAESLHEQEQKWADLALSSLNNMPPTSTQS